MYICFGGESMHAYSKLTQENTKKQENIDVCLPRKMLSKKLFRLIKYMYINASVST